MKPNTHIGEASAQLGDREFVFRPTLANIAEIGNPAEIVESFVLVMSEPIDRNQWFRQVGEAMRILYLCADEFTPELERLLGGWTLHPRRYAPGKMPADGMIALARQMLRHGVIGVPLREVETIKSEGKRAEYRQEFNPVEIASLALAHLGLNVDDAWSMTMTSVVQALAAKFPPVKDPAGAPMTVERNDQAVAWLEKVNKLRAKGAANG